MFEQKFYFQLYDLRKNLVLVGKINCKRNLSVQRSCFYVAKSDQKQII